MKFYGINNDSHIHAFSLIYESVLYLRPNERKKIMNLSASASSKVNMKVL